MDLFVWVLFWFCGIWFTLGYALGMDRNRRSMNWKSEVALAVLMAGCCVLWPLFWAAMAYVRSTEVRGKRW